MIFARTSDVCRPHRLLSDPDPALILVQYEKPLLYKFDRCVFCKFVACFKICVLPPIVFGHFTGFQFGQPMFSDFVVTDSGQTYRDQAENNHNTRRLLMSHLSALPHYLTPRLVSKTNGGVFKTFANKPKKAQTPLKKFSTFHFFTNHSKKIDIRVCQSLFGLRA